MRAVAVGLLCLLQHRRRISLKEIAERLDVSEASARRWVYSFSMALPIRVEQGVVISELRH
jgi:predicted DNA-binding transcriptional regulator YafY